MRAIVGGAGKIELGLNIDFDAVILGLSLRRPLNGTLDEALTGARAETVGEFSFFGCTAVILSVRRRRKGQSGLRVVRAMAAAANAVGLQTAGNFAAPFGFDDDGGITGIRRDIYRRRYTYRDRL